MIIRPIVSLGRILLPDLIMPQRLTAVRPLIIQINF